MRKTLAFPFALAFGTASVALAGSYAGQWALRGPYDVDLIEGNDTALDFQPASAAPVVIGLIDTGIDHQHPGLAGALWTNPGEIAGNCLDDDGNGYIDDLHGIRVDVAAFDGVLQDGPVDLRAALRSACVEHHGTPSLSGDECLAGPDSDATDARAIAGLNIAYAQAATALDGNPLLHERSCPDGFGVTRGERVELARGDAMDYWYGHGTLMAGTMAARSGVASEPASLLDLPLAGGGKLGDHVKIVTCAAGWPGNVREGGTFVMPRGSVVGAIECADYFLDLKSQGVNLVAINVSYGMAEQWPSIDGTDIPMVDDTLFHKDPGLLDAFDRLEAEDVLVVASAHNLFRDIDDKPVHAMYPAAFDHGNVIGVGGINERGTWFGNRGRNTVDIAAPAQRILLPAVRPEIAMMARLARAERRDTLSTGDVPFDFADFTEGTSQATAYVSTMAALLRANAATSELSAPEIRRLILSSGTPLPSIPWMWILRPAADTNTQLAYWTFLGMFEPTTRTLKQNQLSESSLSGRIARLDRALACQGFAFQRIVEPVQRHAAPAGSPLTVAAESYVCAQPSSAATLAAKVTRPDGSTASLTLVGDGDGRYSVDYVPTVPGTYRFALSSAPNDVLSVQVP
ncbi:S8 family serine peptidase [Sorangium sp. So ce861]|uniref:S8 family serine peptidase n=1 Tax=Sorangium sp. So ce861 TaxID=3133323 RepID=UPI003F5D71C8